MSTPNSPRVLRTAFFTCTVIGLFLTVLGWFAAITQPSRAVAEEPLPHSLMDSNVTFKLPDHWRLQRQFTNRAATVLQLLISDSDTDHTPDTANAGITAEPLQPGVTVQSFGDFKLRTGLPF